MIAIKHYTECYGLSQAIVLHKEGVNNISTHLMLMTLRAPETNPTGFIFLGTFSAAPSQN